MKSVHIATLVCGYISINLSHSGSLLQLLSHKVMVNFLVGFSKSPFCIPAPHSQLCFSRSAFTQGVGLLTPYFLLLFAPPSCLTHSLQGDVWFFFLNGGEGKRFLLNQDRWCLMPNTPTHPTPVDQLAYSLQSLPQRALQNA